MEGNKVSFCWPEGEEEGREYFDRPLEIYTDVSKNGMNVGYSWFVLDNDYCIYENYMSAKDIDV